MKEGRGGGKEREEPTHLIENLPMLHALLKIIAEVLRRLTASLLVCSRYVEQLIFFCSLTDKSALVTFH